MEWNKIVGFKFLVGLLQGSIASPPVFQTAALKFLNTLLKTSPRPADRIRLQCELEEAGLDINASCAPAASPAQTGVWAEIEAWRKSYLDMEHVAGGKHNLETENERLQNEVQLLRQALKKLEEDKINLMQIEMELKEKCEDLNEEVTTLKTEMKKPKAVAELNQLNLLDIKTHFLDDDEEAFLSGDSATKSTKYSPNLSTKSNSSNNSSKKNSYQTTKTIVSSSTSTGFGSKTNSDKDSADSALSESESDSGLNWSYPDIPEPPPEVRTSRAPSRVFEGNKTIVPLRYPVLGPNRKMAQRSRSEDRRETNEIRNRKQQTEGETKVVDSSNFFMVRRPHTTTELSNRQSSPTSDKSGKVSIYTGGRKPAIIPSYQLPVAYKRNFLVRGHSTCDLYSGNNKQQDEIPQIPPPDYSCGVSVAASGGTISALVHREITKAVKQISGWI
ncbi:hypothetical protein CEXT_281271 [Caerostris extrusa]|uniref:Uncharacterized protein n=1 Tax=Caerostris extrusa TaxID=172846 RepID=A0AAV4XVS9_CAEEX|nr:hypothetical protein CEXT_281271 [Caerostris extrusa]